MPIVRVMALGAASGLRSTAAPSQLSRALHHLQADDGKSPAADLLARSSTRRILQLALLGELVADKLPGIPARTAPGPLVGRAIMGGLAGGVWAQRRAESGVFGALLGGSAAVVGAYAGFSLRRALTHSMGLPDFPVAVCEDAVAIGLARAALA